MKFRLSTLLLVILLVAALTGWMVERRFYESRLVEETEREGAIASTLSTAIFTNIIYAQLDRLSEEEFAHKRLSQLVNCIVSLYLHKDNAVDRTIVKTANFTQRKEQTTAVLREAGKSLALLNVSNTQGFADSIREAGYVDEWTEGLLKSDGSLESDLSTFVENCLNYNVYDNLSLKPKLSTGQNLEMAERALKLYDAGILDIGLLYDVQDSLKKMVDDPDGKKSKLIERIESALSN